MTRNLFIVFLSISHPSIGSSLGSELFYTIPEGLNPINPNRRATAKSFLHPDHTTASSNSLGDPKCLQLHPRILCPTTPLSTRVTGTKHFRTVNWTLGHSEVPQSACPRGLKRTGHSTEKGKLTAVIKESISFVKYKVFCTWATLLLHQRWFGIWHTLVPCCQI